MKSINKLVYPLHLSQQEIYYEQITAPECSQFNVGGCVVFKGEMDLSFFKQVINDLSIHFDTYRVKFDFKNGEPRSYYPEKAPPTDFIIKDFSEEKKPRESATAWVQDRFNTAFDLYGEHLYETMLVKIGEQEHWWYMRCHHLITDGYGFLNFAKYGARKYAAMMNNEPHDFEYPPYHCEIEESINYLDSEDYEKDANHWTEQFKEIPEPLLRQRFFKGNPKLMERLSVELTDEQKERILNIAKSHGTSIQALTLAALTIFYGRTENRKEIAFGVPIHKRRNKRQRQIAGMFAGAIPFKARYDEDNLITNFIQEIKKQQRYDYRFQTFPFTHLNRKLKLFAKGRSYLFDIMVNYEPMNFNLELEGFETETLHFSSNEGSNPLTIRWCDYGDIQPLMIKFDYQCSYMTKEEVELLSERLLYIIDQFEHDSEKKVGDIDILTNRERQLILGKIPTKEGHWFNQGAKDLGNDRPINVRFEEMVKQNPSAIAVVHEDKRWTYQQLNDKANQVAHCLQKMQIQSGHFVGLYAERSPMFIAGMMGILKCGAIYVPLDPQNPGERIHKMLSNPELQTLISTTKLLSGLKEWNFNSVLMLDEVDESLIQRAKELNILLTDSQAIEQAATDNPENQNLIDSWAYVLYTSGSTGEPKGAISRHDGAINHMLIEYEFMDLAEGFSFLQSAGIGSDISVWQMLGPLLRGGKTVVIDKMKLLDYDCLLSVLEEEAINVLELVPSYIWGLIEHIKLEKTPPQFSHLQWLMLSGEEAPVKMINEWKTLYPKVRVLNAYGPCETSDDVVQYEIKDQMGEEILRTPIGRVVDNMNVFVVDQANRLVPIGVPGEICISGIGVGAGYWGLPEKTEKAFVNNPFEGTLGSVMYKTGDLGSWLPNGELDFLGRIDRQVKVRGNRVELGEIEAQVRQTTGVKDAHILVHKNLENQELVVAFIVMNGEVFNLPENYASSDLYQSNVGQAQQELEQALRNFCQSNLPAYMQPNHYCFVDELPTNLSNKVDQNKLIQLLNDIDFVGNSSSEDTYVAPKDETEKKLAKIWKDLLNLEQVGIHDNFFELGGDSIVIIQVVSRAKRMGIQLSPRDMFQFQTIATLVENLEKQVVTIQAEQGILEGPVELMPIQQRFFEAEHGSMSHYNQSALLCIDKQISEPILEQAVQAVVAQHDALRMQFPKQGAYWWQKYGSYSGKLDVCDFQEKSTDEFQALVSETCDKAQASLNIEAGELIRTVLMKAPEAEKSNRLFIVIHHIVVDGVSWRIIVEDIERAIDALMSGKAIDLGHKTSSYRDCVTAQAAYTISPAIEKQGAYWKGIVNDNAGFSLPTDHEVANKQMADVVDYTVHMDEAYTEKLLKKVNRSYHIEINDILLSALSLTLSEWSGQEKVVIGLEGHGREDIARNIDTSSTVGWFTSLFPVSIELKPEMPKGDLIKSVKERLRLLPEKGIGYGLLRYLHPSVEAQSELEGKDWEIIFNYLGQFDNLFANSKWFEPANEDTGKRVGDFYPFNNKFEVNGLILNGKLTLHWTYCTKEYDAQTVEQLAASFLTNLAQLIDHCENLATPEKTPSDFGLEKAISYKELDQFMSKEQEGKQLQTQIDRLHRLSPLQEGMLFHGLYENDSTAYTVQTSMDFEKGLDVQLLNEAMNFVINNHSILKSTFLHDEFKIPIQCVYHKIDVPFIEMDYTSMEAEERVKAVKQYMELDYKTGFDFVAPPLMRLSLIKLGDDRYKLIWTYHHILMDGWSMPILMEEILKAYECKLNHITPKEVETDHFEDYVTWINSKDKVEEQQFWENYLEGFEDPNLLPFSNKAERNKGGEELKTQSLPFSFEFSSSIRQYAKNNRLTVNTLLQGVWSLLLARYTGSQDVVYGVTVTDRPAVLGNAEKRVGMFINTIPLRCIIDKDKKVVDWLLSLQTSHASTKDFQSTSMSDIQRWANINGDFFDSILVFENYPMDAALSSCDFLEIKNYQLREATNYLLTIDVKLEEKLQVDFTFNASLLKEEKVNALSQQFYSILEQIVLLETKQLAEIKLLNDNERALLDRFNQTTVAYPKEKTIVDLFEQQVRETPTATAMVCREESLTYAALNDRANQLANYLIKLGVSEEELVIVGMNRSAELLISLLAILKCGATYVSVDPAYPKDRIEFILKDTAAKLIVSNENSVENFQTLDEAINYKCLLVDTDWNSIEKESKNKPEHTPMANQLACVMYTSGSTGKPKGVMIEHRSLANYLNYGQQTYGAKVDQFNFPLFTSLSFDLTQTSIWLPLISGGTLFVEDSEELDLIIERIVENEALNAIKLTPSHALLFEASEQTSNIQVAILGGEALKANHIRKLRSLNPEMSIFNEYGPTEATVGCIVDEVENEGHILIGQPIFNTQIYIIDQNMALAPIGVKGEICIGGDGLARGYLNRPELNKTKFITNPFSDEPGARLYRTGDLACWHPEGKIEYFGRLDDQVKIRGYRIELGEIESILVKSDFVKECTVLTTEVGQSGTQLVAYIVSSQQFDRAQVKTWLAEQLPDYMIPSLYVELDEIPLTSNGKVNKKLLPNPKFLTNDSTNYLAPRDETEETLMRIWQDILNAERIGVFDNFFEIGGHSLLAIRVVSAIRKSFDVRITVNVLFDYPTIADLSTYIKLLKVPNNDNNDQGEEAFELIEL